MGSCWHDAPRANVEVGVVGHEWQRPDTRQQEQDIALYLLIWGEAANLRLLPECLCFLLFPLFFHGVELMLESMRW